MKQYKTLENWDGFEKGQVVPNAVAEQFLDKYAYFEDQSILEVADVEDEKVVEKVTEKVEAPKATVKKPVKKSRKA